MDKILVAGRIFSSEKNAEYKILSGNLDSVSSLTCSQLNTDTINFTVWSNDRDLLTIKSGTPVVYLRDDMQVGTFFVEAITRKSATKYYFSTLSAVDLLAKRDHPGGIYTGQTAEEVIRDICGGVPVAVKSNFAEIALYGWLPYVKPPETSARDNLSQVLFAIGASLGTDLEGVLRVEPLWDGVASTITPARMYSGGSVEYGSQVTAVTVMEHQYVQGGESKELFSGTTQEGDVITFDEPMHSLSASGFTIRKSGANYAVVSSGSGTLTGRAYIHTTRQVTEPVTAAEEENVKNIKDATLVSLVNARAVAKRLAAYYRCTETIKNPVVAGAERPGHVVSIYHPYDKTYVPACIASADTTLSSTLRSDLKALVGFKPPQVENAEYLDERVVLTGSGVWQVPEDVTSLTAVLIDPGAGGGAGENGEDGGNTMLIVTSEDIKKGGTWQSSPGAGGKGGKGGAGGIGGKILRVTMDVSPGQSVDYTAPAGGMGGADPGSPGAEPTANTTFGSLTAADGAASTAGYVDVVTGEIFGGNGANGEDGADGGRGGSYGNDGTPGGDSSNAKGGAAGKDYSYSGSYDAFESYTFGRGGAGGGGAANGVDGGNGAGANGGDGADSARAEDAKTFGRGGDGAHGAGGGGGSGSLYRSNSPYLLVGLPDGEFDTRNGGKGGTGGAGGAGGAGCIILYYRRAIKHGRGPLVTDDSRWFLDRLGRRFIV